MVVKEAGSSWLSRNSVVNRVGRFEIVTRFECKLIRINSMPDHIHILVSLPPTMAVASFVHDLKIAAGNFLRAHPDKFPLFTGWARSYYAGTCGPMDKERVRRYIMRQKEHHKKKSYKQEILRQLKRAGIEYDEKYLFRD